MKKDYEIDTDRPLPRIEKQRESYVEDARVNRIKSMKQILIILLMFSVVIISSGCQKTPIKVGFIGSLTTKNSQLSIDARNAVQLGVDQVNAQGGLNGHLIELVIKDDEANSEIAMQKHQEFIDEQVGLVIGHTTSNMGEAVIKSQSDQLLFVSPSMGSPVLSGLDDFFIRTSPLTNNQAYTFMDLLDKLDVTHAVIIYDLMNAEYAENLAKFAFELSEKDQRIELALVPFDSRVDDHLRVADKALQNIDTELVFMISQAMDTAILSQALKKQKPDIELCSVSWSMTEDLLNNGGASIEGMYFVGVYVAEEKSASFVRFKEAFEKKYHYEPSFVSVLSYDAFNVLFQAIRNASDFSPPSIKKAILDNGNITALEESFTIDRYGDSNRSYLIYKLSDRRFVPLYQ